MAHKIRVLFLCFLTFSVWSCTKKSFEKPDSVSNDPKRCRISDVGEAADFIQKSDIQDDVLIVAHGLGNPQALVWRDSQTGKTFYLARVMGTQKKLYYLKEIPEDEKPGVPSRFSGHLLRWDHLPKEKALDMMSGLKSQYNITINPEETYIIVKGQKPRGC